jgi:imidazolonepropionase-like amidohydrolase
MRFREPRRELGILLAIAAAPALCECAPPRGANAVVSSTSSSTTIARSAAGDRTIVFRVETMGNAAGSSVVTIRADGSREATWEFNDRGRGPKQRCAWQVDGAGLLTRLDVTGVDYLKQDVDEHLRLEGGALGWKNHAEHGRAPAGARVFYVPLDGAPELTAALVRALLAAPDHRLTLLPAGSAQLTRAGDLVAEAEGRRMHVVRYEIDGLDFEPTSVWMDDDGEAFAFASTWMSVVRDGWQSALSKLLAIQHDAKSERLRALATKLGHRPPSAGLAIVHARLVDVEKKTILPDATIVIRSERIVAAGPSASTKAPPGVEILDAHGRTAIPGLWDMHGHVQQLDGLLQLANGVTGVRDLGNDTDELLRLKRAWDTGEELGPRLVHAGFIDGRGPFQGPSKVFADDVEEGKRAIDTYLAKGYPHVKLYSSLKPELVAPLAAYAHEKGMRVSGHVPNGMTAEEAIDAGYDELQHINFLFLNFLAKKGDDTRTPLRFTVVAQKAASLDLGSPEVKRFIGLLAQKKIVVDPTLAAYEGMFTARQGQVNPMYAQVAARLPVQVRRQLLGGGLPVTPEQDPTYRASFAQMQKLVKALWDARVPIVAGTDEMAGFTLARELELYERAGIPALDLLAMATIDAARVMRHEADWGSVEPGKYADVALIDGKPDASIGDLRKASTVVKGGVVLSCADLLAAVGVSPAK